jgi:hypothetical protein
MIMVKNVEITKKEAKVSEDKITFQHTQIKNFIGQVSLDFTQFFSVY